MDKELINNPEKAKYWLENVNVENWYFIFIFLNSTEMHYLTKDALNYKNYENSINKLNKFEK